MSVVALTLFIAGGMLFTKYVVLRKKKVIYIELPEKPAPKTPSPIGEAFFAKLKQAKTFDDVFEKVSEIALSTGPDHLITTITDIKVDHERGILYVGNELEAPTLFKFNFEGDYLGKIGGYGDKNEEYHDTGKLALDGDGNIYVLDRMKLCVNKYSPDGEYLVTFPFSEGIRHLSVSANGYVYLYHSSGRSNIAFSMFNPDGTLAKQWGRFPSLGRLQRIVSGPGVVSDNQGYLYTAYIGKEKIIKYNKNGELEYTFGHTSEYFRPTDPLQVEMLAARTEIDSLYAYGATTTRVSDLSIFHDKIIMFSLKNINLLNENQVFSCLEFYDTVGNYIAGRIEHLEDFIVTENELYQVMSPDSDEAKKKGEILNPILVKYKLKNYEDIGQLSSH